MAGDALTDLLVRAARKPDPYPFLFRNGQTVRVLKRVVNDGQTPQFWAGAMATVVSRRRTWLSKTHSYTLRHPNGAEDVFEESELDRRYSRIMKIKHALLVVVWNPDREVLEHCLCEYLEGDKPFAVLHFVGYENKPTEHDRKHFKEELKTDPDFEAERQVMAKCQTTIMEAEPEFVEWFVDHAGLKDIED